MEELAKGKENSVIDGWFESDDQLHRLYPKSIELLANKHWTPLRVANLAIQFLATHEGVKILDIGSGVGKFCLAGAYYQPRARFFGVEQRRHLVEHAETARRIVGFTNVHFLSLNMTQLDFKQFDHFYFYNSFYENLMDTDKIDGSVKCSPPLYNYYNRVLYKKLAEMPIGTRIVTYHCLEGRIPWGYQLLDEHRSPFLKFWMKI
jgi:SAM-dependent methyltransferase